MPTSAGNTTSLSQAAPQLFPVPDICQEYTFWISARAIVTLTLILVLISNVFLLMVTWQAAQTRINPFLFGSLAMSDLLTGALVLPFDLSFTVAMDGSRGPSVGCTFSGVLFHTLQSISLFTFFALSLDRLLTIECPLRYPSFMTWKVNVAIVAVIWAVPSLMYGMIPATGLGFYVYKCWQCMCNLGIVDPNYLTFLLLFNVFIFLATYLLNGRIFYVARKQSAKLQIVKNQVLSQTGKKYHLSDKLKAARSILLALSLFTLCWGPYYSALFCFVLFEAATTPLTEFSLLWLAFSNSFMNFFVFLATYRSFRLHFYKMIGLRNRVDHADVTFISSTN
ncbi:hypothetical protein ACOMHN_010324 [Nucella lapillus]